MRRIKVDPESTGEAVDAAVEALRAGGAIIFPAERLYGLGADATDPDAVARVFELKARDRSMALPVIVHDADAAKEWVEVSELAQRLMSEFWPGPLTLVLPVNKVLPEAVLGSGVSLGIRAPGNSLAREIARKIGAPVTATSANPSGSSPGRTADEALAGLSGRVELVLDAGELPGPPGSTVVRVSEDGYIVLREGVINQEKIEAVLR